MNRRASFSLPQSVWPQSVKGLWFYFAATAALSAAFLIAMMVWDFAVIDEMYHADHIRAHVDAMSARQRRVHIVMTATLDVLYPFAYGGLLAGLAHRACPRKTWLAWPILLCIPVDLLEGVSQVFILFGQMSWVDLKVIVTPIKLGLFGLGCLIGLIAATVLFWRWLSNRRATT